MYMNEKSFRLIKSKFKGHLKLRNMWKFNVVIWDVIINLTEVTYTKNNFIILKCPRVR